MTEHNVAVAETPKAAPAAPANGQPEHYVSPAVDIYETADGFALVADLPGVSQDDLEVSVTHNVRSHHQGARAAETFRQGALSGVSAGLGVSPVQAP